MVPSRPMSETTFGSIPVGVQTFGAATMVAPSVIRTDTFSSAVKAEKTKSGTHILRGLRIFKAGTFKDSMGFERTWEKYHLDQMAMHFRLLRDGGSLPNVPIRVDHSFSARDVVGYFVDVFRAEDDDDFLAADVEVTEPDAYEKWKRGTFRSRSLEVGMYETNEGASYWPVIMGLAFVDIPAVEGLHRNPGVQFSHAIQDDDKENLSMFTFNGMSFKDQAECEAAINYAEFVRCAEYAQSLVDFDAACAYATALDAHNASATALGIAGVSVVEAQHGRQIAANFRVSGQQTADVNAVQRHIDTLEGFQRDTISTSRNDFVKGLAESSRIAVTQLDAMTALVQTMTTEQYDAFRASYEGAPSGTLFARHSGGGGENQPGGAQQTVQDEIDLNEDIIAQHRRAGMPQDKIEKTESFKRLTTLKAKASA